jgi:hypothetical protein
MANVIWRGLSIASIVRKYNLSLLALIFALIFKIPEPCGGNNS